jgi:hypothetical protein
MHRLALDCRTASEPRRSAASRPAPRGPASIIVSQPRIGLDSRDLATLSAPVVSVDVDGAGALFQGFGALKRGITLSIIWTKYWIPILNFRRRT